MNTILLTPDDFSHVDDSYRVYGERFSHIRDILKCTIGDTVKIGIRGSSLGIARITDVHTDSLALRLLPGSTPAPPKYPIRLLCALPRPQTVKKIIYDATVFGIGEIHFFHTRKVEKSYWQSPVLTEQKLQERLNTALSQAVDTIAPKIVFHRYFKPFVEDVLPPLIREGENFLFHPGTESLPFSLEPCKSREVKNFIIGPEGGFTEYEISRLYELGLSPVTLGRRILRVEQAVSAIIGYSVITLDNH
ncbi:MAG: 16S rRNA (uracil(1498)-N(3))-methyltransferase [Fibrobacterota bacterium]